MWVLRGWLNLHSTKVIYSCGIDSRCAIQHHTSAQLQIITHVDIWALTDSSTNAISLNAKAVLYTILFHPDGLGGGYRYYHLHFIKRNNETQEGEACPETQPVM